MDVAMLSACQKQTFYDYLDLARAAHSCEIAKVCEENERLKAHVNSLLNRTLVAELPERDTNSGMSVGVNNGSDGQTVHDTPFQPMTSWAADKVMLNELGEIVLLERQPGDLVPKGASLTVHSSGAELSPAPYQRISQTSIATTSSLESAIMYPSPPEPAKDDIGQVLHRWKNMCNLLWESWKSDVVFLHPAWRELPLQALSMFMARKQQGSRCVAAGHCLSERIINRTEQHRFISCGVLSPDSSFIVIWQSLSMMLCVYDIVVFPIQIVDLFIRDEYSDIFTLSLAIFWSIDIAVSLHTGFPTNEGYTELRRLKILKRYAKTWMTLDVSLVVFEWISLIVASGQRGSVRGVSNMVRRLSRMLKCGRLIKLGPTLVKSLGQLHSEIILSIAKLVLYLCVILTLNHYIACLMYACWNWERFNFDDTHRYLTSLHWAITHSALGSMDIVPQSDFERLFSTIMLVFSMCLFSTFLSAISTAITHLSNLHAYSMKQSGLLRRFFDENRISRELSRRIWTFMWKHRHLGKARLRTNDVHCLSFLPSHMLAEIKVEMFLPILVSHPMLKLCSAQSGEAIVQVCLAAIEQKVLRPSEEMLWTLDAEVKGMFFVVDGSLLYQPVPDPGRSLHSQQGATTVSIGMWACEAALWCQHAQVYGPFVGGPSGADVVQVNARDFQDIMRTSTLSFVCLDYAQFFVEKFNQCSHDPCCSDSLFNDQDVIKELVEATTYKRSGMVSVQRSSVGLLGKNLVAPRTTARLKSIFNKKAVWSSP